MKWHDLSLEITKNHELGLGMLKAFLRFLMEREVLPPELLSKRMIIKVPDGLPRAMDPDDVRQLLAVLENVRNRALILILLRTGMRVGELLNTIVEDVHLKERRIEIYEASKTRVGRVVYLSDDALKALKAWYSSEARLLFLKVAENAALPISLSNRS